MLHDPQQQLEELVGKAVEALRRLPDEERAALLTEMQTVVFRRAAEAYGLRHGKTFADRFVNTVALRLQEDESEEPPAGTP
ncbi:MAG: hypothetical protein ACTHOR_13400 [Devosia sp.]|jgi:hypothetical protein|nr:hypothetical protein [Devosiaceae bacterium]